jgi:hypothetical protein
MPITPGLVAVLAEAGVVYGAYVALVKAKRAAGWLWGPHGNIQISLAMLLGSPVPSGSCSDWQNAVHTMLCGLNLQYVEACRLESLWHRAVLVRPRAGLEFLGPLFPVLRLSEFVLDPWFTGAPGIYTRVGWSSMANLPNWTRRCC